MKILKGNQYCLVLNVLHKIAVVQSTTSLLMLQEVIHSKKISKASESLIFE